MYQTDTRESPWMYYRPAIDDKRITEIEAMIANHPDWSRTRISKELCKEWEWLGADGRPKDISCRDMLRSLDKAGRIALPVPRRILRVNEKRQTEHVSLSFAPLVAALGEITPVSICIPEGKAELAAFKSLLAEHHYLGFERTVGENMKYFAKDRNGRILACLLFGSAAWTCAKRDEFIGWDNDTRKRMLPMMTNNTRFLVLPHVRVSHLASHLLSLVSKRVSNDWMEKYGHSLICLETFVERARFKGTCYKAANWQNVGCTKGRGKGDRKHECALPIKDIYLYPLVRNFRLKLTEGEMI